MLTLTKDGLIRRREKKKEKKIALRKEMGNKKTNKNKNKILIENENIPNLTGKINKINKNKKEANCCRKEV